MKVIKKFLLERKLLKIWRLERSVQGATSFPQLALIRVQIFNLLWDNQIEQGRLKGKIMALAGASGKTADLDQKKQDLSHLLLEFRQSCEAKLLNLETPSSLS